MNNLEGLIFIPLVVVKCILSILVVFLILSSMLLLSIGISLPLASVIAPFFITFTIRTVKGRKKIVYILLLIIFYPVLVSLFFLMFCIAIIVAPFSKCFDINHHGVLDFY